MRCLSMFRSFASIARTSREEFANKGFWLNEIIYIDNMHSYAGTTTLNLYGNLYYAKTKCLLFETKDIFQECNSTIKTLLGLKTAAKDIWSILGRAKSSF